MDPRLHLPHFRREVRAFEAAARKVAGESAPDVPSCPGWSLSDLVAHLGRVHRYVARAVDERVTEAPDAADITIYELPADHRGWPMPDQEPNRGPLPVGLVDWFAVGAARLEGLFAERDPADRVWTWSVEQTVGFWLRMQTIEAAVHRWDAQRTVGTPDEIPADLAADAVAQALDVMAPARRAWQHAPAGAGEVFRFRQSDGTGVWAVQFDGDQVRRADTEGSCDVELAGSASDLMLYQWQRVGQDALTVRGDRAVADRWFTLVPPV